MKQKILSVLFLIIGIMIAGAQNNTLTIPSVTSSPGSTVSLPVDLDNAMDVVAVQFTLTVPDGLRLQPAQATLTERGEGMNITMREISGNKYMAMVFSPSNVAVRGRTGTLVKIPLVLDSNIEEGTVHTLTLSDVVIGAIDGSNVTTGYDAGLVTVAKSPDLEVVNVVTDVSTINPGEKISVSWEVNNIGGLATTSGWSEQVVLTGAGGTKKVLAVAYHDASLNAGGTVSRNVEINVPDVIGIDGDAKVNVRLIPNSDAGEPSWLDTNNTATMASSVQVGKKADAHS